MSVRFDLRAYTPATEPAGLVVLDRKETKKRNGLTGSDRNGTISQRLLFPAHDMEPCAIPLMRTYTPVGNSNRSAHGNTHKTGKEHDSLR